MSTSLEDWEGTYSFHGDFEGPNIRQARKRGGGSPEEFREESEGLRYGRKKLPDRFREPDSRLAQRRRPSQSVPSE